MSSNTAKFYCPLDLPLCYELACELNELCKRTSMTALLTIFAARRKQEVGFKKNLEMLINSRLSKMKTILPTRANQLYGIEVNPSSNFKYSKNNKIEQSINQALVNISLQAGSREITMGTSQNDSIFISTEVIDATKRHVIQTNPKGLETILMMLVATSKVYASQWINIQFKQLYPGNEFGEHTDRVNTIISNLSSYYIENENTKTYGLNLSFKDFCRYFQPPTPVKISAAFITCSFTIVVDYDEMPSTLHTLAKSIENLTIKCVMEYDALDTLRTIEWKTRLSSITYLYPTPGRHQDFERIALSIAIYGATLLIDETTIQPYVDYYSDSMVDHILGLVRKYNTIAIAASKGSGKSRLISKLPENILVIDSDVRGQFYTLVNQPEHLAVRKLIDNGYTSDPTVLALLYDTVLGKYSDVPSIYEIAAADYIENHGITLKKSLSSGYMLDHYRKFSIIYKKINDITDKKTAEYFNMTNLLIQYASLTHKKSYGKIIHFMHNSAELYGMMNPAVFSLSVNVNTTAIHLMRERTTSPAVQLFLSGFYIYNDTFTATKVNLFELERALALAFGDGTL